MWGEDQQTAFRNILQFIANITKMYHYDQSRNTRVKCDASHSGLGAALEQEIEKDVWVPIAFASRFLNDQEKKYSTNELELLAIVWSCEHFRKYLLGYHFVVLTDHKAIISALKTNRGNKTHQSRLTRWADRLLPFDFDIFHISGCKLGIVDYLSRFPTFEAPRPSSFDEQYVVKCNKSKFVWGEDQQTAFRNILQFIANITKMYHYDQSRNTRVKCDASHSGLGAALEQEIEKDVWVPIAFASRFLNDQEKKYSTNELELLAIVWSCEHFRKYLLGYHFVVLTDHKAIISALKTNRGNKTHQSRLTRWADRLLPFDFDIFHISGCKLGIVDYLSRFPTFEAPRPSSFDEQYVVKCITRCVRLSGWMGSSLFFIRRIIQYFEISFYLIRSI